MVVTRSLHTFIHLIDKKQYQSYSIQSKITDIGQPLSAKAHFDNVWSRVCNRPVGWTPTLGIILITNEKLIENWNEILLVSNSKTNSMKTDLIDVRPNN